MYHCNGKNKRNALFIVQIEIASDVNKHFFLILFVYSLCTNAICLIIYKLTTTASY